MFFFSLSRGTLNRYLKEVVQLYDNVCEVEGVMTVSNRYFAYGVVDGTLRPGSDDIDMLNAEIARAIETLRVLRNRSDEVLAAEAEREANEHDGENTTPTLPSAPTCYVNAHCGVSSAHILFSAPLVTRTACVQTDERKALSAYLSTAHDCVSLEC